jgi:endoglucanase
MAAKNGMIYIQKTSLKHLLVTAIALLGVLPRFALSAETPAHENRMVHRDGSRIVDGDGHPLKLRGVNLGGWLLWEPWMWGGHLLASESKLSSRLESVVSPEEMAKFRREVYDNFITEADIQRISTLGFNVVRVPMNHTIFESGGPGFQILDRLLSWADRYHVFVVLDLHSAPGGQAKIFTADSDGGKLLWDSPENQSRTLALWKSIAEHYKDRRIVAGYDILNEPAPESGSQLADMDRKIVAAIREVDPAHMVIVEGSKYASDFSMFPELLSANQAYSFHMYTRKQDDRSEKLAEYSRISKTQNVPMWCGEFGENNYEMIDSTVALFANPENDVDGWAFWTWKRGPAPNPTLMTIDLPPQWKHVVERDSSPLALGKPRGNETLEAMQQFVQAIRLDHNRPDAKMISILTSRLKRQ